MCLLTYINFQNFYYKYWIAINNAYTNLLVIKKWNDEQWGTPQEKVSMWGILFYININTNTQILTCVYIAGCISPLAGCIYCVWFIVSIWRLGSSKTGEVCGLAPWTGGPVFPISLLIVPASFPFCSDNGSDMFCSTLKIEMLQTMECNSNTEWLKIYLPQ